MKRTLSSVHAISSCYDKSWLNWGTHQTFKKCLKILDPLRQFMLKISHSGSLHDMHDWKVATNDDCMHLIARNMTSSCHKCKSLLTAIPIVNHVASPLRYYGWIKRFLSWRRHSHYFWGWWRSSIIICARTVRYCPTCSWNPRMEECVQ